MITVALTRSLKKWSGNKRSSSWLPGASTTPSCMLGSSSSASQTRSLSRSVSTLPHPQMPGAILAGSSGQPSKQSRVRSPSASAETTVTVALQVVVTLLATAVRVTVFVPRSAQVKCDWSSERLTGGQPTKLVLTCAGVTSVLPEMSSVAVTFWHWTAGYTTTLVLPLM